MRQVNEEDSEKGKKKMTFLECGIYEAYHSLELKDYQGNVPTDAMRIVKKYIVRVVEMRQKGLGLFFWGSAGTGKTGLMIEVLKGAVRAGLRCQFASLGGLIQKFAEGWYSMESRQEFFEQVRGVDMLAIDDIGKELETKNGIEIVVFDNALRYRSMRNRPTLLTSNLSPKEIEKRYSEFIVSLMREKMVPVHLDGADFRLKIAQKNIKEFMNG